MDDQRLVYMAEQIAREFTAQGEAEAAEATAGHLRLFWDPRMKAQLRALDPAALSPVLARAVTLLG